MEVDESSFCLVLNIPGHFHSSDLRAFFSNFVEKKGFSCFHFRHRPEHLKIFRDERLLNIGGQQDDPERAPESSELNSEASTSGERSDETEPRTAKTNCCVVAVVKTHEKEFMQMYHNQNWAKPDGQLLSRRVRISKLRVTADTDEKRKDKPTSSSAIPWTELMSLPELNPPSAMPQGNVGTPLSVFMDLIRSCKLPAYVIKKLGLEFPKSRSKKRYGAVGLDYGTSVIEGSTDYQTQYRGNRTEKKSQGPAMDPESDAESEGAESVPSDDDRDAEEWERYEALHEDVDKQERTKERLYEDELEVVWDKGSSGLVFYTDANYWDQQEGDFDEKCSKEDDWDVDMSTYYDYAGSDKDARDLRAMEVERRRRQGEDASTPAGFERHTKGIGSKLLKKTGWTEGSGVGSSSQGIVEPVETEGQHPRCKRGLGYHGEKLDRRAPSSKKQRASRDVIVSTVYDKPEEEKDTIFRTAPPRTIKYREAVKFRSGGVLKPDSHNIEDA